MRLGVREALVDGTIIPGDVTVDADSGSVTAVGVKPAGASGLAAPGFVEVQINGIGGVDFTDADVDAYRVTGHVLATSGVTSYQPTLISLPESTLVAALDRLGTAMAVSVPGPRILGAHLEGPFLSPVRAGAHNPEFIVDPDPDLMDRLLAAGPVNYMTVAPERPGGLDLISRLVRRGVVVAAGHSDADAATAHAAFDTGVRAVTHLFNACRAFHHREPGIGIAALVHPDVVVTLIVDGVHLAPDAVRLAVAAAPGRFALVTDAIAAAGRGDGLYHLGRQRIHVNGSEARLDDGTLAGSVLTMDQAVRNLIELGVAPIDAIGAANRVPAALIRRKELGTILPGTPADIVVLDGSYNVVRTVVGATEVFAA
jgi:N-acetylglucosamine-6-phosphate deacetylase